MLFHYISSHSQEHGVDRAQTGSTALEQLMTATRPQHDTCIGRLTFERPCRFERDQRQSTSISSSARASGMCRPRVSVWSGDQGLDIGVAPSSSVCYARIPVRCSDHSKSAILVEGY